MKAKQILLVTLAAIIAAAGCNKSEVANGPFMVDGERFETLQSAFDAACSREAFKSIKLMENAEGAGAACDAAGIIELDLDGYTYTLSEGAGIEMKGDGGLYLTGSGGVLVALGSRPAVESYESFLHISGNVSLEAEYALRSGDEVIVDDSFEGTLSGKVCLRGTRMTVSSAGRGINIRSLTLVGDDCLECSLDCRNTEGTVSIKELDAPFENGVWAENPACVSLPGGKSAHVHTFGEAVHHSASCCTQAYDTKTCAVCGFEHAEYSDEIGGGPCPAEDLVHYDAVEAVAPFGGCAEHWQCPHCLRCWSDTEGQNAINPFVLAPNFALDSLSLHVCDDIFNYRDAVQTKNLAIALAVVGIGVSLLGSAAGIADNELGTSSQEVKKQLDEISKNLKELKSDIKELNTKMDVLTKKADEILSGVSDINRKLDAMAFKEVVDKLQAQRTDLLYYEDRTALYFDALAGSDDTAQSMYDAVKNWAQTPVKGYNYAEYTSRLLYDFKNPGGDSFLQTIYDFACYLYPWEHESYGFIYQAVYEYAFCLLKGVAMTSVYYAFDSVNPQKVRSSLLQDLNTNFNYLYAVLTAIPDVNAEREANYRRFNLQSEGSRKTYLRRCHQVVNPDFADWIASASAKSCKFIEQPSVAYHAMLDGVGLSALDYITNDEVKEIYDYCKLAYNSDRMKVRTAITDERCAGFVVDKTSAPSLFFGKAEETYKKGVPVYRFGMLTWKSWPNIMNDDRFDLNTAFAPTEQDRYASSDNRYLCKFTTTLRYNCNIRHSDGAVTGAGGDCTFGRFYTILVSQDDPGYVKDVLSRVN